MFTNICDMADHLPPSSLTFHSTLENIGLVISLLFKKQRWMSLWICEQTDKWMKMGRNIMFNELWRCTGHITKGLKAATFLHFHGIFACTLHYLIGNTWTKWYHKKCMQPSIWQQQISLHYLHSSARWFLCGLPSKEAFIDLNVNMTSAYNNTLLIRYIH